MKQESDADIKKAMVGNKMFTPQQLEQMISDYNREKLIRARTKTKGVISGMI
jgi:hypothetical protein